MASQSVDIDLPSLHQGQKRVRAEAGKLNVLVAGRGWRKTTLGLHIVSDYMLAGKNALWTAPVVKTMNICWANLEYAYRNAIAAGVVKFNKTEHHVDMPNGGMCDFRSLERPDNARGPSPDVVVMDEAAFVDDEEAWYGVIQPMVIHRPDIVWWMLTTPNKKNWLWRVFEQAKMRPTRHRAWQFAAKGAEIVDGKLVRKPHDYENPYAPWEEMCEVYEDAAENWFRQEYLAEFIDESGGVFHGVDGAIQRGRKQNTPPSTHGIYQGGVDLARTGDYTVISVHEMPSLKQVYWKRLNKVGWEAQYDIIEAAARLYNNCVMVMDATGIGDAPALAVARRGVRVVPLKFNQFNKKDTIDHLGGLIEKFPGWLMDIPQQTFELKAFEYKKASQAGQPTPTGAPRGANDDCVIALALACYKKRPVTSLSEIAPVIINAGSAGNIERYSSVRNFGDW